MDSEEIKTQVAKLNSLLEKLCNSKNQEKKIDFFFRMIRNSNICQVYLFEINKYNFTDYDITLGFSSDIYYDEMLLTIKNVSQINMSPWANFFYCRILPVDQRFAFSLVNSLEDFELSRDYIIGEDFSFSITESGLYNPYLQIIEELETSHL